MYVVMCRGRKSFHSLVYVFMIKKKKNKYGKSLLFIALSRYKQNFLYLLRFVEVIQNNGK